MGNFLKAILIAAALGLAAVLAAVFTARQTPSSPAPTPLQEIKITLIEGWTLQDMAQYLEKRDVVSAEAFLKAGKSFKAGDYEALSDKPKSADLQGYIFPDTYLVAKRPSTTPRELADEIITKTLNNFSLKFSPELRQQAAKNGFSVYETLILASIIEKETGRNAVTAEQRQKLLTERKTVAGIFYNRLKAGMPLQSDATVNFVTGKNTPQASLQDLEADSPYNTYKYKGLPPGPICNPSLSSIEAAVNPIASDYFYFLHRQDTGAAVYSKTFEQHVRNKTLYFK